MVDSENYQGLRKALKKIVESNRFVQFITALILFNAVTLGLETDKDIVSSYGSVLHAIDNFVLVIFSIELCLKLFVYRVNFFKSGWNIFDLIIVTVSWIPASGPLSVMRALRILRILRLLSVVPQMRRVVAALGHSIPGMASVVAVLCLLFYVSSVLTTKLFGNHPDPSMQEWFGTIGDSAYTLFQIMTLESWSMGIVRPTMEYYPMAWLFFVPFIIITSFAVLNLFIGIIVDAMQVMHEEESQEEAEKSNLETLLIMQRLDEIQKEMNQLNQRFSNK